MRKTLAIVALVLGVGALAFHPSRRLSMQIRAMEVVVDDGTTLRGTISKPRWSRKPVPGIVLVHGSGPLTRDHLRGDTRALVKLGFAVLAYDKRGAGASSGVYLRSSEHSPEVLLRRLAGDAAAVLDLSAADPDVDPTRLGFFGASQAGWIIPPAVERARTSPRFHGIARSLGRVLLMIAVRHDNRVHLSVRPVAARACARPVRGRPAAHGRR